MRFSVDRESISEIESLLTSYSDDINKAFNRFQEEISEIAVRTNYKKLLNVLQKIIDIYNDVICREMRSKLISDWVEEGESLHDFAEAVYMGEESEEAVRRIESSLYEIFSPKQYDNLLNLEFSGDSNAEKDDFNKITGYFESLSREIDSIRENNLEIFSDRIENNELYRFLIPIVEAVGISIREFCDSAKKEMEQLGDHYAEKMISQEETVRESKASGNLARMELDQSLFDTAAGIGGTVDAVGDDFAKSAPSASSRENTEKDEGSAQSELAVKEETLTEDELVKKIVQEVRKMLKERDLTIKSLNDMLEKNYKAIAEVQKIYGAWLPASEKVKENSSEGGKEEKKEKKRKNYGRYIVDNECKRAVNESLPQIQNMLSQLDRHYAEKYKGYDKGFNIVFGLIKGIASLFEFEAGIALPCLEPLSIVEGKMSVKVEPSSIIDKVGSSTVLKSIKKKFWDLTKTEVEIPKLNPYLNQYMYEHYQYKFSGKDIDIKSKFYYLHVAINDVTKKEDRRALEDAAFAAQKKVYFDREKIAVSKPQGDKGFTDREIDDINRGKCINLVRAALACERVEDEKANELTDKLFESLKNGKDAYRPRIDIHPLEKNITVAMIRAIPDDDE